MAPAWQAARSDVNATLKDAGRSSLGGVRPLLRKSACRRRAGAGDDPPDRRGRCSCAACWSSSACRSASIPHDVISFQISLPPTKYDAAKRVNFHRELGNTLKAIPGVRNAGISSGIPFGVGNYTTSPVSAPGNSALPPGASVPIDWRVASPGYFETMKIPLLRGRDFTDSDTATAPDVMILSRATARTFWGDEDPIGRAVRRVADGKDFTVVGIVGDVRSTTLNRESPALYYSSGSRTWPLMDVVLRTQTDPAPIMTAVRQKIRALDPELPLSNIRPMTEWVSTSAAQPRLNATLLGRVRLRGAAGRGDWHLRRVWPIPSRSGPRSSALRMALGADRGGVLRLIVREGMTVGIAGIAIGVLAAGGLSRTLSALVYGVSVWDPATYVGCSVMLALVALLSCVVPALRAARVDPMVALRLD